MRTVAKEELEPPLRREWGWKRKPIHSLNEQWTIKGLSSSSIRVIGTSQGCNIRADGCSDDHQKCVMFSGIFTQSIILFVNGQASMKPYKTVGQTGKNWWSCTLEQLEQQVPATEHTAVFAVIKFSVRSQNFSNRTRNNMTAQPLSKFMAGDRTWCHL